jgi:serine/threonine-protein kinase
MTRPTEYRPAENESHTEPRASGTRVTQFVAGEVIAERYRLLRKLGSGGMGVVWVAHSLALGVDVAIKLIRTGVGDADLTTRMAREAQATATLGHPAIVRVFDFGTTERGDPFLVMELAEGETLAAVIARERKLPPVQALQLILPVVDGLRCAHERGIVHRDIKPENVFIARDALGRLQPKLLDFGIAKLEKQPQVSRLTRVGEILGSPEFMSPEQARGSEEIDARTDIWSTCVVLYEMLTGSLPFRLENYNALMQAILHERPVSTLELGAGDRDLWRILAKGLEKSREKRWNSMAELGEALAFWLYDHGVSEDVSGNSLKAVWLEGNVRRPARRVRRMLLAGASLLLVTLIALLAFRSSRGDPRAPAASLRGSAPPAQIASEAQPSATSAPRDALLPSVPASPASASSEVSTKPSAQVGAKPRAPTRSPQKSSPAKSIRDFGF